MAAMLVFGLVCTVCLLHSPLGTEATESAKIRAKRALDGLRQSELPGLLETQHGSLLLVPIHSDLERAKRSIVKDEAGENAGKIKKLSHSVHVQSDIRYRYATTLVTSQVFNPESKAREVYMTVILPETAFISRFAIEVGGQLFVAYVKEKEDAWKEYQEAVSQGKTAGHVGISARHSNQFRVSVNTEAKSSVTFYLLYEELLQRKRGIYEHVINLTPRQKLKDFGIDVQIKENRPLKELSVPGLKRHQIVIGNSSETLEGALILKDPSHTGSARVSYRPQLGPLQKLLKSNHALQFSVRYDVDRQSDKAGEIQVIDGYFAHFVAPENLPPMAKHVVFVLDVSGSMLGKKMNQVKNAMKSILTQLRDIDFFSILQFSDNVTEWRSEASAATKESIDGAKSYVDSIEASGGTNIHQGLMKALQRISESSSSGAVVQPMIIFLTDGHPTVGVTAKEDILQDIQASNAQLSVPIFCLSFGRFADFGLLKTLSLQNHAFTRKIYAAADAALQLEGFYKEVSSPILRGVQFKYQADEILAHSLTSTNFHTYYQGSEMVVAGRLASDQPLMDSPPVPTQDLIEYEILATEANGPYKVGGEYNASAASKAEFYPQTITETVFDVLPRVRESVNGVNYLERLWAYLTIKDLLERVARGDLNSCNGAERAMKAKRHIDAISDDDEDYAEASGHQEYYYYDEDEGRDEKADEAAVADIIKEVGDDENIVICDNIERALYLSLKYEFVTPLTSLVVISPDEAPKEGDLSEIQGQKRRHTINFMSGQARLSLSHFLSLFCLVSHMKLLNN